MTRRVVAPRYLEPNPWGRGCYLIADDGPSRDRRMFKLERITEAQLTNERFTFWCWSCSRACSATDVLPQRRGEMMTVFCPASASATRRSVSLARSAKNSPVAIWPYRKGLVICCRRNYASWIMPLASF